MHQPTPAIALVSAEHGPALLDEFRRYARDHALHCASSEAAACDLAGAAPTGVSRPDAPRPCRQDVPAVGAPPVG